MKKHVLVLIGIIVLALYGCAKKNYIVSDQKLPNLSATEKLLTAHTWKESAVTVHKYISKATIVYDVTKQFAGADRDDYTLFFEDGTFLFEEGKSKHTSVSAQKYQKGEWRINEKDKTLTLEFNHSTDQYTILALNAFKMVLKLPVVQENSSYEYIITYTPEIEVKPQDNYITSPEKDVYIQVDTQPQYPGGSENFIKTFQQHIKYPKAARKNNIEGKVIIQFIVNEDGKPSDFKIVKGLGYGCDEATITACKAMAQWKPGMLNGKPVKVQMETACLYDL